MLVIKCCKNCVPPKRHSGCGANCKEYQEERKKLDEEREIVRKNKSKAIFGYIHDKNLKFKRYKDTHKR